MSGIDVVCAADGSAWDCSVRVDDGDGISTHAVRVAAADIPSVAGRPSSAPADVDAVERLVTETFVFLLERESKTSILARFDLSVVGRYFPEYDREIRRRLSGSG